jgi:hypothetical protein
VKPITKGDLKLYLGHGNDDEVYEVEQLYK